MKYVIIIFCSLLFCCCNVKYYVTPEGGYRLYDPKKFKYNKSQYKSIDNSKSVIDTNCIYVMDSTYNKWNDVQVKKENYRFARFFSGGQVLFVYKDGKPDIEMINNKNIGIPGYYYVENGKIKISMFKNINGGILIDYLGEISANGNLIFYEQPMGNLLLSKEKDYSGKSFWSKMKIEKIEHYKPDW